MGRRATLLLVAGAVTLAGCSSSDNDSASDEGALTTEAIDDVFADRGHSAAGDTATEQPASDRAPGTGVDPTFDPAFDLGRIGRQVVIEMRVTMTSPDLRAAVDGILRSAAAQGGGIAASEVDYGTETRPGAAVLVVKVPPDALSTFLSGLDRLGTVGAISQDAQDVTDQLTDLDVRITNARRSVERVRALLTEAKTLGEVIDLEAELTRRQTDLERLEASQRNLADRVALSTVTIEVWAEESSAPVDVDDDDGIVDAFRTGIDAFTAVLFGIAFVLAVLAPFLAVAVALALVAWVLVSGRRRRARVTPASVPMEDADVPTAELSGTGAPPTPSV